MNRFNPEKSNKRYNPELSVYPKCGEIAMELKEEEKLLYLPAYSAGLEEYIEAMAFLYYFEVKEKMKTENLATRIIPIENIQSLLSFEEDEDTDLSTAVPVPVLEYLTGLADATGEFMRMCVNSAAKVNSEESKIEVFRICSLLRFVYEKFVSLSPFLNRFGNKKKNIQNKLNVMRSSLQKAEDVCYMLEIRCKEFPDQPFNDRKLFDLTHDEQLKNSN